MRKLFFAVCLTALILACEKIDLYEKTVAFPDHAWSNSEKPAFHFDITDTAALYNIYAVIRHTDAYHYNNLFLNVTTKAPSDSVQTQQVELKLGDDAKGWLGTGIDDIIEQRILLTRFPIKLKKGEYTFILTQIMREDPLENMMNAGIRVEKVVR